MAKEEDGAGSSLASVLSQELQVVGFFAHGFLDKSSFLDVMEHFPLDSPNSDRYGLLDTATIAVVALRYGEGTALSPAWARQDTENGGLTNPVEVALARFARANWYAEIDKRLYSALKAMRARAEAVGIPTPGIKMWRRLTNSGLPEKALALKANLGWVGKNNILIASGEGLCSSAVLLGLILCPVALTGPKRLAIDSRCGSCRKCIDACPTKALNSEKETFTRIKCIQHWTYIDDEPPRQMLQFLAGRLYGCDICLEACPYFLPDDKAECSMGILGKAVPAQAILKPNDKELKVLLRGTVLDRSWISLKALKRNAAIRL